MTSTVLHRVLRIAGVIALVAVPSALAGCSGDSGAGAASSTTSTTSSTPLPRASIAADMFVQVRGTVTEIMSPYLVKLDAENYDKPLAILLPRGKTTAGAEVKKGQQLTVKGPVLKIDAKSGATYGLPPNAISQLQQVNGQLVVSGAFAK